jgi:HD-GYP domain-containing protein (c-di-GMP phosphodiesterase class II)
MGGDEFCVIADVDSAAGERLVRSGVAALSDSGEGWSVGCSWGLAWIPSEATGASEALRLADERMYAQKTSRATAGHQTTAALVQVLIEQDVDLSSHISRVAELATATARRLNIAELEVTRIGLAAQLHDIGKTAIPQSILDKPDDLDDDEWGFMRCHTLIGERIIAAAPSLAHTANLVRSSHERVDGTGYPDHLAGSDIPLGSRIIAVCDAFDAMVAARPYRGPVDPLDAIAELRRSAGTQFDPDVVEAFSAIATERRAPPALTTAD